MQKFSFTVQEYTTPKNLTLNEKCNNICVTNKGTTDILFNGIPLSPNESYTIGGHPCEVLDTACGISFAGAGVNRAIIVQKFYL